MTINREVNGQTMKFELTDWEILDAYLAKEHEFDMATIEHMLEKPVPKSLLSRMATFCRNYIDSTSEALDRAVADAFEEALEEAQNAFHRGAWMTEIQTKVARGLPLTKEDYELYNALCEMKEVVE